MCCSRMDASFEPDEPLTPMAQSFIQPLIDNVINCTMSLKNPIDPQTIRTELMSGNSALLKHPRFSSLMVKDSNGREHWRKTHVDVDRHIITYHNRVTSVNDYVADLCCSTPLPMDKPLWEIHLLVAHNVVVLRMHHALGDGASLMSILLSGSDRKPEKITYLPRRRTVWTLMKVIWYTLVYVFEYLCTEVWKDKTTVLSGGEGVELLPRQIVTARFNLDDMKIVKRVVPKATINDVFSGVVASGISKYLEIVSPGGVTEGQQLTCLVMVNLRPQAGVQDLSDLMNSGLFGNKVGMIQFPIYYHGNEHGHDPIRFVKTAKSLMDKKKLSYEALFSLKIGQLTRFLFGSKLTNIVHYRIMCNTTFLFSNMMGPSEEISFAGNLVKYIRVTSSSTPHAMMMHMVSYAGMADLQIQVVKDIIPQPELLAKCFEDALLEMKEAALKDM